VFYQPGFIVKSPAKSRTGIVYKYNNRLRYYAIFIEGII